MDKVTECLDALIEEMRESRAYQNYLWMEEKLEKDPDLKSRVDDYRIRNYRLQQSENVDLYDAVDSLERDSYALRKSEKANAYLKIFENIGDRKYAMCRTVFQRQSASEYRKSKTENQKESAHVRKEKGCRIPRSADRCERNRAPAHLRLRNSCDHSGSENFISVWT